MHYTDQSRRSVPIGSKPLRKGALRARRLALAATTLGAIGAFGTVGVNAADAAAPGAAVGVYTSTNATTGNSVEAFLRQPDGSILANGTYATGGLGSAAGGSQGSVTLSKDRRTLYVVDSGSNQLTEFPVLSNGGLGAPHSIGSGGTDPTSVAVDGDLAIVLNAGSLNVTSFVLTHGGLVQVAGGTQPLSAGASDPRDVTITPDGSFVVVTEKASSTIDTFAIGNNDVLGAAVTSTSDAPAAFASAYARGELLVADAGGADTSAVSPYQVEPSGALTPEQPALPDGQSAACWIATGKDGYAFVANAGSSSISTYQVLPDGYVAFLGNTSLPAGASVPKPLDLAVSSDGRNVSIVDEANSQIDSFAVGVHGTLSPVGSPQPVQAGPLGLAVG